MPPTTSILTSATLLVALAVPGLAQEDPRARAQGPGRLTPEQRAEMVEFEVISVDRRNWTVMARDVDGGAAFRFKMPPRVFEGQRFTADFSGGRGGRVSARGVPDATLDELVVEAPLGEAEAPGGRGRGPAGPGRPGGLGERPRAPGGPADYVEGEGGPAGYAGGEDRGPDGGPADYVGGPGGGAQYEIVSVDPERWVVTARGPQGKVDVEVDPDSFVGYRFKAPVQGLRRGQAFALLALNQRPIEACCKLLSGGR